MYYSQMEIEEYKISKREGFNAFLYTLMYYMKCQFLNSIIFEEW